MGMKKPTGPLVDEVDKQINIKDWWPPDDEDVAYQVADLWRQAARDLETGAYRVDVWVDRVKNVWIDGLGVAYYDDGRLYGKQYRELAAQFNSIADFMKQYGDLVKKTKDDIKVELAISAAFLIGSFFLPGSLAAVAGIAAARIAGIIAARIASQIGTKLVTGLGHHQLPAAGLRQPARHPAGHQLQPGVGRHAHRGHRRPDRQDGRWSRQPRQQGRQDPGQPRH